MQLKVQAVHRVVRLVDQSQELAALVEPLRLESPPAAEQETEHRLNQVAKRSRLPDTFSSLAPSLGHRSGVPDML